MNVSSASTMRAIVVSSSSTFSIETVPLPELKENDVLIRVRAAGVNRADLYQVEGRYLPPKDASPLLGLEVAGEIVALGSNVTGWNIGQRVCSLVAGGGYAEYAAADAGLLIALPENVNFIQGAALPEALLTVWLNLFELCPFRKEAWYLIHCGASGVGSTAIQLLTLCGGRVITTASTEEKRHFALELGAVAAFDYHDNAWVDSVKKVTNNEGVYALLDMLGGPYLEQNLLCLQEKGTLLAIAVPQGSKGSLNMARLVMKNLQICGSTLRSQSLHFKREIVHSLRTILTPFLATDRFKYTIDRCFPLEEAAQAHNYLRSNQHKGKVILTIAA